MRIIWLLWSTSLYATYVASVETSTLQYLDLNELEDLKRERNDLNRRVDELNKREEWRTILLRQTVDRYDHKYNRTWHDYQIGFQDDVNFFIGLEKIYELTNYDVDQELLIILKDNRGQRYAKYDLFRIASESAQYNLKGLGTYSGDAGDSLGPNKGLQFSTFDNNNSNKNCASSEGGGWWFSENCDGSDSMLTGNGITWIEWIGHSNSLISAEMKIRSKCKCRCKNN